MKHVTKKFSAICAVLLTVIIAVTMSIFSPKQTSAEEIKQITEFDYSPYMQMDEEVAEIASVLLDFSKYNGRWGIGYGSGFVEIPQLNSCSFMYIILQGAGGAGGNDEKTNTRGLGGGSGAFAVVRINLNEYNFSSFSVVAGRGGKNGLSFSGNAILNIEDGQGIFSFVDTGIGKHVVLIGGKKGTTTTVGAGGTVQYVQGGALQLISARSGLNGGDASTAFTLTLNEPGYATYSETFSHKISGFAWSGVGGAASPFAKGGDGGVWMNNGQNGSMGSGGGGVGLSGKAAGNGGDGYVKILIG